MHKMQPITTAVILAAGLGMRLRDTFTGKPKGLLSIAGVPLVERSIQQLMAHDINDIIIVTGYLAEDYEALAENYLIVRTVHNPYYADSGSMYSLYCARKLINKPFLLLESDLLYENRALSTLLDSPFEAAILVSGFTLSGDEIYIETKGGYFYHMSKQRRDLQAIMGELVGISKISDTLFAQMIGSSEAYFQKSLHWHYEDGCLNQVGKEIPIPICFVPDLVWCEIDNAEHLRRAKSIIWAQLQRLKQSQSSG